MKKFLLFIAGLVATLVLLANLGPMILLGLGVWVLYAIFKKFVKTSSTSKKILLAVFGLMMMSFVLSNSYSIIGLIAGYVLYVIYKQWHKEKDDEWEEVVKEDDDPFTNFEKQWAELNR